jgi:hypothetical protein
MNGIETYIALTHAGDARSHFCARRIAMDEAQPQAKLIRAAMSFVLSRIAPNSIALDLNHRHRLRSR